jgi:hypothetical protein
MQADNEAAGRMLEPPCLCAESVYPSPHREVWGNLGYLEVDCDTLKHRDLFYFQTKMEIDRWDNQAICHSHNDLVRL